MRFISVHRNTEPQDATKAGFFAAGFGNFARIPVALRARLNVGM